MIGIVEISLSLLSVLSHMNVIYASPVPSIMDSAIDSHRSEKLENQNDVPPLTYFPWLLETQYNGFLGELFQHLDDIDWHESVNLMINDLALSTSAKIGYLGMVRYVVERKNGTIFPHHLDIAAVNGHLDIIKYLFTQCPDASYIRTLVHGIQSKDLDVIKYLYELVKPGLKDPGSVLRQMFWFYVTLDDDPELLRKCLMDKKISAILGDLLKIDEHWIDYEKYKLFMDGKFPSNISDPKVEYIETHKLAQSKISSSNIKELMGEDMWNLVRMLEKHRIIPLKKLKPRLLKTYLYAAAKYGEEAFFRYIASNKNVNLDINLLNFAAAHGQLMVVKYLIEIAGIKPTVDTLLFAHESLDLDLKYYLLHIRGMAASRKAAEMVDRELRRFHGGDKFFDSVSELNVPRVATLQPQSAMKDVQKTDEIKKVHFNLGKNELYLVKRYIDKAQEIPKNQPNQENAFILLLKGIIGHPKEVLNQRLVKQGRLNQ